MLDVISTAKNTQWFSFPSLCTKYTYPHVANEDVDFQTIPGRNCFAEFNKKSGFELLRTVSKDCVDTIQRIKKRQIEDLSCGAVSKLYGSELAVGMSTGLIQVFSIQKGEFMPFKFRPDKLGNSVVGMDYSNDDEYLAAVYESADICLFGMKTGIKTNSFVLDASSTLVRFHPVKKFVLAAASFQGAITMLDVQTKKKLFYDKAAHSAPTRDISMFSSSQDLFVSCGYDCNINVYDLRKRTMVQQYTQPHPMSTVCVSSCGTFCVAGNLKGDVISFDFRNMKEPMDTKRAHDSAVIRVAFVPVISDASNTMFGQSINVSTMDVAAPISKGSPKQTGMDSFAKFVDVCRKDDFSKNNESKASHRDSWADLMPTKKKHNFSNVSAFDSPGRVSIGSVDRSKRVSRMSMGHSIISENIELNVPEIVVNDDQMVPESQMNVVDHPIEASSSQNNSIQTNGRRSTFSDTFAKNLRSSNTSTPPNTKHKTVLSPHEHNKFSDLEEIVEEEYSTNGQAFKEIVGSNVVTMTKPNLHKLVNGLIDQEMSKVQANLSQQLQASADSIKTRIDHRLKQMDVKTNEMQNHYFQNGLQGCLNLHNNLHPLQITLEKALVMLVEQDEFALNYFQTKYECIALRRLLGKNPKTGMAK